MDYQGNYFPDEHDENESVTYRRVKGFFKWTLYGISFLIYAIVIVTLILNRDNKILKKNYWATLHADEEINLKTVEMYHINTKDFMEEYGTLQLHNVDYTPEYGYLEIGVKFNAKKLTSGDYTENVTYVLTDNNGNTYVAKNIVKDGRGRYGFARICFSDVKLDLDSNDLNYNMALIGSILPALPDDSINKERSDVRYTLSVYRISDGELLYDFDVYDNSVTYTKTEYEK